MPTRSTSLLAAALVAVSWSAAAERPAAVGDDGLVPANLSGAYCVPTDRGLELWRPETTGPASAVVRHRASGATARVTWSAGEARVAWPAALPVEDGTVYAVQFEAALQRSDVELHVMPHDIADQAELAVWLATRGCAQQLRLLVGRPFRVPEAPADDDPTGRDDAIAFLGSPEAGR